MQIEHVEIKNRISDIQINVLIGLTIAENISFSSSL
jgi:hypothetical protein